MQETAQFNPVLAAFDSDQLRTFGDTGVQVDGWTYVSYYNDPDKRFEHYAVSGTKIHRMDFTPFKEMPALVFRWMVELDFPNSADLAFSTHFDKTHIAFHPLSELDVERIWLWKRVNGGGS